MCFFRRLLIIYLQIVLHKKKKISKLNVNIIMCLEQVLISKWHAYYFYSLENNVYVVFEINFEIENKKHFNNLKYNFFLHDSDFLFKKLHFIIN